MPKSASKLVAAAAATVRTRRGIVRCGILTISTTLRSHDMAIPVHELEVEVLALPPEERARLLERLIESFEPESHVQDAWVALSLRREADVRSGKVALVPGAEAVSRVRARIA